MLNKIPKHLKVWQPWVNHFLPPGFDSSLLQTQYPRLPSDCTLGQPWAVNLSFFFYLSYLLFTFSCLSFSLLSLPPQWLVLGFTQYVFLFLFHPFLMGYQHCTFFSIHVYHKCLWWLVDPTVLPCNTGTDFLCLDNPYLFFSPDLMWFCMLHLHLSIKQKNTKNNSYREPKKKILLTSCLSSSSLFGHSIHSSGPL